MVGISVDHSHTRVSVTDVPQRAGIDLTQIGLNGVYEAGPWTFSAALVHGRAGINSDRDTATGSAVASYDARLWGAITEASYYYGFGTSRIVPKVGADWLRVSIDAFRETGGVDAASVAGQVAARAPSLRRR